jgi:hypothetical protein
MHKSKPKLPPPPAPPPELSDEEIEAQRRLVRERDRKRKGRASTILTGQMDEPSVGKKTLLGQ